MEWTRVEPFQPELLLALETSCDETSVAVLRRGQQLLAHRVASQEELHARYGGVVPEVACRRHFEVLHPLLAETLEAAGVGWNELSAIAVTCGPGLIGAVLVGVTVAKTLAQIWDIPLLPVNHLEGHLFSPLLDHPELQPPWVSLLVSGGHTQLVLVEDWGRVRTLGRTRDDAAGEAFDKVAKMLGLGYPGGPRVQKLAESGNPEAILFPRPMKGQGYAFSFSGLKTAVRHQLGKHSPEDICASFQRAVSDVLTHKTLSAAREFGVKQVCLAGGVAANAPLREALRQACARDGIDFHVPRMEFCTDNGAMIARAGWVLAGLGLVATPALDAHASFPLRNWDS